MKTSERQVLSIIITALTLSLGAWFLVEPIKEEIQNLEIPEVWVGVGLIVFGVWIIHKLKLKN